MIKYLLMKLKSLSLSSQAERNVAKTYTLKMMKLTFFKVMLLPPNGTKESHLMTMTTENQ
jgi:hypothetical protein